MTPMDWIVAVAAIVGLLAQIYFPWKQNQIFKQQNAIFKAEAESKGVNVPIPQESSFWVRYWPTFTMLLSALLIWGAVGSYYYIRQAEPDVVDVSHRPAPEEHCANMPSTRT